MLLLKIVAFTVCFFGISCKPTSTRGKKYEVFESDIMLSDPKQLSPTYDPDKRTEADGWELLQSQKYLWPKGRIPYKIANNKFDALERNWLDEAIKHIEGRTCIKFVPKENWENWEPDYVLIDKPTKSVCESHVGKQKGEQVLYLHQNCFVNGKGIPVHELLHAIGLWHEHGRPDRDEHVEVLWASVDKASVNRRNYYRRNWGHINDACEDYDYLSIMHYNLTDVNVKTLNLKRLPPNIEASQIGARVKMSFMDAQKVNRMYRCHDVNCGSYCPQPPNVRDHSNKCRVAKTDKIREKCLKKLAQLTYCY